MIASWTCPWCGQASHSNGKPCPLLATGPLRAPQTIKAAAAPDEPNPSNDGLSGASGEGGNQSGAGNQKARLYECFWPRCSDHRRCAAFGSCVAIAQREARDEIMGRRRPQFRMLTREEMGLDRRIGWWPGFVSGWFVGAFMGGIVVLLGFR